MVSTMPCVIASSANSLDVQCVMGRPDSSGGLHARVRILHHCSAVMVAGAPVRSPSASRCLTLPPPRSSQHLRHSRTVVRVVESRRATSRAFSPSASARTIRARSAVRCSVFFARTNASNSCRSASVTGTSGGFGPGTTHSFCLTGRASVANSALVNGPVSSAAPN
jgi:hypothetical protein